MVVFINDTTTTGIIFNSAIQNVFGSEFIFLFFILLGLITIALIFRIPLELTIPLVIPFLLYAMAQNVTLLAIGGVFLIFIAILFSYYFLRS